MNYSQRQIFDSFMRSKKGVVKCYPFIDGDDKLISMGMLRHNFDLKQRQFALTYMQLYEKTQGNYRNISEVELAMIYHPVFIVTKTHYLQNYFYQMAAHVYMKANSEQNNESQGVVDDLMGAVIRVDYQRYLAYYRIPIHNMVESELFTSIKTKQYQTVIQDKYKKDIQHIKVSKKSYFETGYIE